MGQSLSGGFQNVDDEGLGTVSAIISTIGEDDNLGAILFSSELSWDSELSAETLTSGLVELTEYA